MSKGRLLAICVVWLGIVGALAVSYRLILKPSVDHERIGRTSSSSNYTHELNLSVGARPGAVLLRSPRFRDELTAKRIRATPRPANQDDLATLRALRDGDISMSVFGLAGFLRACATLGETPATIVAVLDESRGADALLAAQESIADLDKLNRPEVHFVVGEGSSGETLARVVMTHFRLDQLLPQPYQVVPGESAVYEKYRQAKPNEPLAFALSEPYVARVLQNPKMRVLADSNSFRGYFVDVLVVSRDFQVKNGEVVRDLLGAYFRAAYAEHEGMVPLLLEDARQSGSPLTPAEAERVARSTWWKNTLENFAHFGIQTGTGLPLLEDMIRDLTAVLAKTGGIRADFAFERPAELYFDKPLRDLQASGFHPGLGAESVRGEGAELPKLGDTQWNELTPLGTLAVPELAFARGTDRLTESSQATLRELGGTLHKFPRAYLRIRGNAATNGNVEANKALAERRAQAAAAFLLEAGVHPHRVRAEGGEPSGRASVSFVLGQVPY